MRNTIPPLKESRLRKAYMMAFPLLLLQERLRNIQSTITNEVKKYRTFQPYEADPQKLSRCALFKESTMRFLCDEKDCVKMCKSCFDVKLQVVKCSYLCPEYKAPQCPSVRKAPYVCNSCSKSKRCNKHKAFYIAQNADKSLKGFT